MLKPHAIALLLIALLPIGVAMLWNDLGEARQPGMALNLLGHAAGILGLTLLLMAAAVSIRVPRFDRLFGGLTKLWKVHHVLGAAAFLLLMLHPLLLSFAAARLSLRAASSVLFPTLSHWAVWLGWLALITMMVFLAPTFSFFGPPEYQRWKRLHALSGLAVVLGLAHTWPLSRSLPGGWRSIWVLLGALAIASSGYRLFFARWIGRKPYTITEVRALASGVVEVTLRPEGRLLRYEAGQFIYLSPLDAHLAAGRGEEHPYTLSSAPHESVLRVVVKDFGDATHALQTVAIGSKALVEGPYGRFLPAGQGKTGGLWLGGGVGLTPFLSRARALENDRQAVDIHLVYCVQDESRAYFLPELQQLASRIEGLHVWPHYFYREGPLTADFIAARCPDFSGREIYVCGPAPMITAVSKTLVERGVRPGDIHSEEFSWL